MDNRSKELLGYWLSAIGQTMSALANTPFPANGKKLSSQIDLWGNVLQGTGTAFIADTEEEFSLEKLGNQLEAIGNLVTVTSFLAQVNDEIKAELGNQGDIIQTLGVGVTLPNEWVAGLTLETFLDIYGHFLQIIAIKDVNEELVNMIAEWSQAVASILSLIHVLHDS